MSFQEEWQRKKEERHRRRMEQEGGLVNGSSQFSPTKASHVTLPGVQLKQTSKSPKPLQSPGHGEKELNEAEKKAEELRRKREQERIEAEQRAQEELHRTNFTTLTPERKEEIRRAREERERLERQQEEERKAKMEEDARKMREDIQRRRQEAEAKRKQAEEGQMAYSIPKYDIADNIARAKREKMQSSAEMQAARELHVAQSLPDIRISTRDPPERLREIAAVLHARLAEVYGDIYDLQQRRERQEYDLNEMNARIKDLSKNKTVTVTTIESGHVSMLKEKALSGDEKAKQRQTMDVKASLPSTGNIADRMQQLQSNLKKDATTPDKSQRKEFIKKTYSTPEQIKEELEASKKEIERFRQQREENRRKREEDMKMIEEQEAERRRRAEEERRQQAEERERMRREKEEKERARRAMMGGVPSTPGAPVSITKVVSQTRARNREETIAERVPDVTIRSSTSEEELRNLANDIYNRLKTTLGDIFDLQETKKKNEYYMNELHERVGYLKTPKSTGLVNSGIVSKMKDGGVWSAKKQNGVSWSPKANELGGIAAEGGVRGRLAMFSGGQDTFDCPKIPSRSPAKINIYK